MTKEGREPTVTFDVGCAQFGKSGVLRLRESFGHAVLAQTATEPRGCERTVRAAFLAVYSTQTAFQVQPLESYLGVVTGPAAAHPGAAGAVRRTGGS